MYIYVYICILNSYSLMYNDQGTEGGQIVVVPFSSSYALPRSPARPVTDISVYTIPNLINVIP